MVTFFRDFPASILVFGSLIFFFLPIAFDVKRFFSLNYSFFIQVFCLF